MRFLILIAIAFLCGCNHSKPKEELKNCCAYLGINIAPLISKDSVDCGASWQTNYWMSGIKKSKAETQRKNNAAVACVKNAHKHSRSFVYQHTYQSFPDGGYNYYAIRTTAGKNVLITYGGIGDEPLNFYVGYCESLEIEASGKLMFNENTCSPTTDNELYEKIRIQ